MLGFAGEEVHFEDDALLDRELRVGEQAGSSVAVVEMGGDECGRGSAWLLPMLQREKQEVTWKNFSHLLSDG